MLIPYETTKTFRYGEVTNYVTEVWPLGQVYTFYIVMNKDTWNQLPADIQGIINDYIEGNILKNFPRCGTGSVSRERNMPSNRAMRLLKFSGGT